MKTPPLKKAANSGRSASTRHSDPSGAKKRGLNKLKASVAAPAGRAKAGNARQIANRADSAPSATTSPTAGSVLKRLAVYNKYREQFNPLRGLTLAHAISLLEDYNRGRMADLQWTYFHIEQTDADLIALLELGLSRLAEMDWDIATSEDADPALADAQATYLREQFDRIDNLEEAIEHLALARFRGFAHCELVQDAAGQITHFEIVDQWNVVRDGLKGGWRYNPDARSTDFVGLPPENDMPPERFLYREVRRPVNRIALLKFVRAGLSDKDWDAFIEIYGLPSGVVIGPANVPKGSEADFEASAASIAEGGSGYLPNGSTYVQNKAEAGNTPFKGRLDHLSEKLVLAGTGGKLTMLTDATGLGSGASDAHSKVFDTIASAEAGRISREITKQLVTRWLDERFPGQKHVAYFKLAANEETDTGAIIADVKALHEAGFDLDPAEVTERTGWKVTKRVEPAAPGFAPTAVLSSTLPPIRNRSAEQIANQDAAFRKAALADLTAKDRADQKPLLDRLAEIDAITDDAAWLEAMRKLDADMPALLDQVVAAGGKAEAFNQIYAAALVSGAAEAAAARPVAPSSKPA